MLERGGSVRGGLGHGCEKAWGRQGSHLESVVDVCGMKCVGLAG